MCEQQPEKLENEKPVAVEDMPDDRENAPAEKVEPARSAKGKKSKKRKKKKGVPVTLVIVLLVLVIVVGVVFGAVLGYGLGRKNSSGRLQEANNQIDELTDMVEDANAQEIDVFTDTLSAENEAALNELSGALSNGNDDGQSGAMMSGEAFGGVDEKEIEPVIVAEYKGGSLTSVEVNEEYNRQMTAFVFSGFTENEVSNALISDVMERMVSERVLQAKAKQLGILQPSDADKELIAKEAEERYAEKLASYKNKAYQDGMSEEEIASAAAALLEKEEGATYEGIYAEIEENWWEQKLFDYATSDVEVDSADVLALYQQLLEQQKADFTAYPDDYEYAQRNGDIIVYNPENYRAVKIMRFGFDDDAMIETVAELEEELEGLDPQSDAERISEIQNQLDACYATPEARAKNVVEKLAAGEKFEELLLQYGDSDAAPSGSLLESGYHISAESPLWDKKIVSTAMAMTEVGEVSDAFRTADGVCIISYAGEVASGEVPMDKLVDALTDEALRQAKQTAYDAQRSEWLEEADVKYYPERMQ